MCCYKLWFVSGLSLFQCVGSNVIVFPWLTPNNTIWFSSDFCHLNHASNWHSAISISLAKKQRHSYYTACLVGNGHCFAFKLCYVLSINFGLFIILKQTTNYANSTKKQPIQQISNGLFLVFSQRLLCSLCIFDKSSKATGYASLCHLSERNEWLLGALHRAFVSCSLWGQLPWESRWEEVSNKEKSDLESPLRNLSAILTSDIWNMTARVCIRTM